MALPADERPVDPSPVHTDDLPATPLRDRNIPASAWIEAPAVVREAGADLPGAPEAMFKREIHGWLLWRAGPARGADARYIAVGRDGGDGAAWTFRLRPDGTGSGEGPDGVTHERFRSWKEALRDHAAGSSGSSSL